MRPAWRRLLMPARRSVSSDGRMPLMDHLRELRNRLITSLIFVALGALVVGVLLYDPLLDILKGPYCDLDPEKRYIGPARGDGDDCQLIFSAPLSGIYIRIKVSLIAGAALTAPLWLYQVWAFVSPGLHRNERRYSTIFVVASTVLFVAGALLAYVTLSTGLKLLVSAAGEGTVALFTIDSYLGFVTLMLLVFGASFEIPLLVVMLNVVGVLTYQRLRRLQRTAVFLIFVFAAVATPSQDPFTMLALSVPICVLFECAVVFAYFHDRRKARREAAESFHDLPDDQPSPLDTTPSGMDD